MRHSTERAVHLAVRLGAIALIFAIAMTGPQAAEATQGDPACSVTIGCATMSACQIKYGNECEYNGCEGSYTCAADNPDCEDHEHGAEETLLCVGWGDPGAPPGG